MILAVMFSLLAVNALAIDPDSFEPDDTYQQAKDILTDGSLQNHNFHIGTDYDYVKFNALAGSIYQLNTSNLQNNADTVITLYDSDGVTQIKEDDDSGEGVSSFLSFTPTTSGVYYLRVKQYDNGVTPAAGGIYDVSITNVGTDEHEPDDTYQQAKDIPVDGTQHMHSTHHTMDIDYMKFTASQNKLYKIETSALLGTTDTAIVLFNTDGTTIIDDNNDGGSEPKSSEILYLSTLTGVYYLSSISKYTNQLYGQFNISVNEYSFSPDQYEPDDTVEQAALIEADGQLQSHSIFPIADKDYFKFNAVFGRVYSIETSKLNFTDTLLTLYDTDGIKIITYDYDSGLEDYASKIIFTPNASGIYFLKVENEEDMIGDYSISIKERGILNASFVAPSSNITVKRNEFFTVSSKVICNNFSCGNVTAILDPKQNSASQSQKNNDYTIRLKSRTFDPLETSAAFTEKTNALSAFSSKEQKQHFLLQFFNTPTQEERRQLARNGIRLLGYIPHNTWIVSIDNKGYNSLSTESFAMDNIRALSSFNKEDKIELDLMQGKYSERSLNKDNTLTLLVQTYDDVKLAELKAELENRNAMLLSFDQASNSAIIKTNKEDILNLASSDLIKWIEQLYEQKQDNDGIRNRIGVEQLQTTPHYLNGSGIVIGEWDGGWADNTHQDLQGRVTIGDLGCTEYDCQTNYHSTHVAGTILGDGSLSQAKGGTPFQWRGMAPAAKLISYEWWGDPGERSNEFDQAINTYNISISTNSWSSGGVYGSYPEDAQGLDNIIRGSLGKKIVITKSAGNRGSGFNTITTPGAAKNIISVGASNSDTDSIAGFSSRGPTQDGRIKPDLVAPGCQEGSGGITSTYPNNEYNSICGTSMSTPAVAGSIALILEKFKQLHPNKELLPSSIKSLLMTSAVDLGNQGPDFTFGYGRINVTAAIDMIENIAEGNFIEPSKEIEYSLKITDNTPKLKVTLVWDDYPAELTASQTLVNDLDIKLYDPLGNWYSPWVLDPNNPSSPATKGTDYRNNVEQIEVDNPIKGTWTVRVIADNIPYNQAFSLTSNAKFINENKGIIPMNAGEPFYTISQNPVYPANLTCLQDMGANTECTQTWLVNATGDKLTTWKFFTLYENDISTLSTEDIYVTIKSVPYINPITLSDNAQEGALFRINFSANDDDLELVNQTLTYSTNNNSKFNLTKFNNTFAGISFLAAKEDLLQINLTLYVTDEDGFTNSKTVVIPVNYLNDAPVLSPLANNNTLLAVEDVPLTFLLEAADDDLVYGDLLVFNSNDTRFTIIKINSTSANVSFTPGFADSPRLSVKFDVNDSSNANSGIIATINVVEANDPPVLNAIGVNDVIGAIEDIPLSFFLTANDEELDKGDSLAFSSNDTRFTVTKINITAANVSFTPTNNDVPQTSVKFTVTDLSNAVSSRAATINVLNTNDAPEITSFTPLFNDPKIPEDDQLTFNITPRDIDLGDSLTVSWYVNGLQVGTGNTFAFNANNNTGIFTITTNVTDLAGAQASHSWILTVADRPVASTFDPNLTTDFSNITDLSNVSNVKIGKTEGQLKFNDNLDLRNVVDLDNAINISTGFVEVRTSIVPEFANKPATLTMNNLNATVFTKKPLIKVTFENGTINNDCESLGLCTNVALNGQKLTFDVKHFTSFQAVPNTTQEVFISKLVFDKIKIVMPSHKETVVNGDTVDKVKPGDSIEVEVDVRNSFADTTEIHDVNLEGIIEKIDNGDDLEDDSQDFDLDGGDDKKISLNFNIPYNADKIAYKLRLKVSGQDSAGKTHEQAAVISLLIDKKTHALAISKLTLNTPVVRCTRTVELTVKVNNIGENEEDDTVLRLTQPELSFNVKENEELDEGSADDDDNSALEKRYVISVPRDFNPGTYPITARAYYDGTKLSDEKSIDLFVEDCLEVKESVVPQATQAQRTAKAITQDSQQTQLIVTNVESTIPEELPQQQPELFDEEMYITLLAVGFILLFGLCALFTMVLVMKRR